MKKKINDGNIKQKWYWDVECQSKNSGESTK